MKCFTVALAIILLGVSGGCATDASQGYVAGGLFPDAVRTVAVPIFSNDTFERDVEFELTDALIKEIEARTPYKVTASERADSILLGSIRRVEREEVSKSRRTGLSEEVVLSVFLDFEWRDLRTNRPLVQRESFAAHGLFVPSAPAGEPIELGEFAAVQKLARMIVDEMQSEW